MIIQISWSKKNILMIMMIIALYVFFKEIYGCATIASELSINVALKCQLMSSQVKIFVFTVK
jgi:uncharacterized MnhB-related membrane protein